MKTISGIRSHGQAGFTTQQNHEIKGIYRTQEVYSNQSAHPPDRNQLVFTHSKSPPMQKNA